MDPKQIHLGDWQRLLMGDAPWIFLIEVAARAAFTYFILTVMMRMMGRRVAAQLSLSELAIILTLGASAGLPFQVPDKGVLPAAIILGCAILFQRGLSYWTFKNQKIEFLSQGDVSMLAADSRLFIKELQQTQFSRERLLMQLRSRGIQHLGQVRRIYLEPTGELTVWEFPEPRPGLSILPEFENDLRQESTLQDQFACKRCGHSEQCRNKPATQCRYCGCDEWTHAVDLVQTIDRPMEAFAGAR